MTDVRAAVSRGTLEAVRRPGAFDAVVVGGGATGGLAACLLSEAGMQVLVLDAGEPANRLSGLGRMVARRAGLLLRGASGLESRRRRQPIQSQSYAWPLDPDAFVDDTDLPYATPPGKPFVWIRSRGLGGRLTVPGHGRQYYRMGPGDFEPSDGLSPNWPLSYDELAPWYAGVEGRLNMSGSLEGIPWLPDSTVSKVTTPTEGETWIRARIGERWPRARVAMGRFAAPTDFLEQAARTGRLTVRAGAVARELEVEGGGRIRGIRWVDLRSRRTERVESPLVFLCASALESTRILLTSTSPHGPGGIGATSGALGRHLMDHVRIVLRGTGPAIPASPLAHGRCLYLPRFDSRDSDLPRAGRGFGIQLNHGPASDGELVPFAMSAYGEMLPNPDNRVELHPTLKDAFGIPALRIECSHGPAEIARADAEREALLELARSLDVVVSHVDPAPASPGLANHECGTARMGLRPESSVADRNNECWEARGLYLVDGACLPSQGTQNPTMTYLALTARACAHAVGSGAR